MGKNFFIVLSISAFSARAGNPPSMIDKAEEIPVEGVDIQRYSSKVDIFFYTDKSSPYHNRILDMECLKKYNKYIYRLSVLLGRTL